MGVRYEPVLWNRDKRRYDLLILAAVLLFALGFAGVSAARDPFLTPESLVIRLTGGAAFALLHVILAIGPLARLDRRHLPLLYNRRHLGVAMALLGLVHGAFSLIQFHTLGTQDPLLSLFSSNPRWDSLVWFPFQPLGFVALCILVTMAATSHDFWLAWLGPRVWKSLHMSVYFAYALLILHVALGALQAGTASWLAAIVAAGALVVLALHVLAARAERAADRSPQDAGWIDVAAVDEIPMDAAIVRTVANERVAIFRHAEGISAVSNVCRHQHGPLGEGRIVDGCITCPWHGYQYRPEDGCAPAPFTEKLPTFAVRVEGKRVLVDSTPREAGTALPPAAVGAATAASAEPFYVGYLGGPPAALARFLRGRVIVLLLGAAALGATLAFAHAPQPAKIFEWNQPTRVTGSLQGGANPRLWVDGSARGILLVAPGKHGAGRWVDEHAGRRVALSGSLIYRDDQSMIELVPGSIEALGPGQLPSRAVQAGEHRFEGEIVDSKCFLGVMAPGSTKPHRACASLCIRGGIPPVLLVRDAGGEAFYLLLEGPGGESIGSEILPYVAEPVALAGQLSREEEQWTLRVDPSTIQRLHP